MTDDPMKGLPPGMVLLPAKEAIIAASMIRGEWGAGSWSEVLPALFRLLDANQAWDEWYRDQSDLCVEDAGLEPPIVLPEETCPEEPAAE